MIFQIAFSFHLFFLYYCFCNGLPVSAVWPKHIWLLMAWCLCWENSFRHYWMSTSGNFTWNSRNSEGSCHAGYEHENRDIAMPQHHAGYPPILWFLKFYGHGDALTSRGAPLCWWLRFYQCAHVQHIAGWMPFFCQWIDQSCGAFGKWCTRARRWYCLTYFMRLATFRHLGPW